MGNLTIVKWSETFFIVVLVKKFSYCITGALVASKKMHKTEITVIFIIIIDIQALPYFLKIIFEMHSVVSKRINF